MRLKCIDNQMMPEPEPEAEAEEGHEMKLKQS